MKRSKRRVLFITLIGIIALITYQLTTLIVDEEPQVSDIIIIPEGSLEGERALKAKELLDQGYSSSGLVMPSPIYLGDSVEQIEDPQDKAVARAIQSTYYNVGFTDDQILAETEATSTYTNAVNTLALMEQHNYQSAIVVSSDYHMRRVQYIYDKVNVDLDYDFDLTYVAAYHPTNGELARWYQAGQRQIWSGLTEVYKMWGYRLRLYHVIDFN